MASALCGLAEKAPDSPLVAEAFHKMYSSDFSGAQTVISRYIAEHPQDPLGYSVRGSALLFSELDRLGILESEFFESDKSISDNRKKLRPDKQTHDSFYQAIEKAQALAQVTLDKNPDDPQALFAMCLAVGETVDYMALVEKKQIASLSVNKRAYRVAKHLLQVDPSFTDAYLTTGFTEYLVGALPVVVRWFVKFDDVQGDKEQGFQNLRLVARDGHYLKPLAKILLAAGYLREKKPLESQKLLGELAREFPTNPLIQKEFAKVNVRVKAGG
jgi:hypothetical protein